VIVGQHGHELLVQDRAARQQSGDGGAQQGHVDAAVEQDADLRAAEHRRVQFQPHERVAGAVGPGQPRQQPPRGGAGEPDADLAALALLGAQHRLPGAVGLGEHPARVFEEHRSRVGEPDLPGGPLQQPHPQVAFQVLDLLRERWLCHAQARGGAAEVELLGHRGEGPQVPQLHDQPPLIRMPSQSCRHLVLDRPRPQCIRSVIRHPASGKRCRWSSRAGSCTGSVR
jgi:hypothetical protein